jgi:hypothetical protein
VQQHQSGTRLRPHPRSLAPSGPVRHRTRVSGLPPLHRNAGVAEGNNAAPQRISERASACWVFVVAASYARRGFHYALRVSGSHPAGAQTLIAQLTITMGFDSPVDAPGDAAGPAPVSHHGEAPATPSFEEH